MNVEEIEYARRLVAMDWVVTRRWNRLHKPVLSDAQLQVVYDDRYLEGPVRLSCGRLAAWISIPGVLTRMGAERCKGCCYAEGLPAGKGSPKNDDACRVLLGLDGAA